MAQSMGFHIGQLPVSYLGIPLVTRNLSARDCAPLIERIKTRISSWAAKTLSYAGRLQLIQSVLYSIHNLWSRHFILPKVVIDRVNQLCSRYFWKEKDDSAVGTRVSWNQICKPKSEGGLGLRDTLLWNSACIIQQSRRILANEGSLWVAWLKAYMMKNSDFLQVELCANASWSWRKIVKLRDTTVRIHTQLGGAGRKLTTSEIYNDLRLKERKVAWQGLIWYPLHIPKHSLISWMAILDKLPTRNRLLRFGMTTGDQCLLCQTHSETRNHLFIECSYSNLVWRLVLKLCGLNRFPNCWTTEISWLTTRLRGKSLIVVILKIAWNAFVYSIWRERNCRYHSNKYIDELGIFDSIVEVVRLRLAGRNINHADRINHKLCKDWGLL